MLGEIRIVMVATSPSPSAAIKASIRVERIGAFCVRAYEIAQREENLSRSFVVMSVNSFNFNRCRVKA